MKRKYLTLKEADFFSERRDCFVDRTVLSPGTTEYHGHEFYEFCFIHQGELTHIINGEEIPLSAGCLWLIRPGDCHAFRIARNHGPIAFTLGLTRGLVEQLSLFLGANEHVAALLSQGDHLSVCMQERIRHEYSRYFEQVLIINSDPSLNHVIQLRQFILSLISMLFCQDGGGLPALQQKACPDWLTALVVQMQEKTNFRKGLPALLKLACRSQEHVNRCFKQYLTMTPTEFINDIRLEFVALHLAQTNDDINELILESGFNSVSYFYNLFKQKYGMSPKQYRLKYYRSPF